MAPAIARMVRARQSVAHLVALAAIGAAPLSGCGDSQARSDAAALEQAGRILAAASVDPANPPLPESREKVFGEASRLLQPITTRGQESPNRDAALRLLSRAQAGQAQVNAGRALEAQTAAFNMLSDARMLSDRYAAELSFARALEAHDPAERRAELQSVISEREAEIAEAEAQRAEVAAEVAELEGQAEAHLGRARSEREQAGTLRTELLEAPAEARVAIIEEVVEHQGRADRAESEAARSTARAQHATPRLRELENTIQRLTTQRELLTLAIGEVDARVQTTSDQAAASREAAADAGDRLSRVLAALDEHLKGPLTETFDAATSGLSSAIGTASRAPRTGEGRSAALWGLGRLNQELTDLHWARAQVWEATEALLERVTALEPPPAGVDRARALLAEATSRKDEALAAAGEALVAAREAIEQAGGRGAAADRSERVLERLGAVAEAIGAPVSTEVAPEGGAPEPEGGLGGAGI